MKRVLIACAIMLLILVNGCWSLWEFAEFRQQAAPLLAAMEEQGVGEDGQNVAEDFLDLWLDYEKNLLRLTRRESLEEIGRCAARLPVLSYYGDETEFFAAVQELNYLLNDLWDDELPHWRNLV